MVEVSERLHVLCGNRETTAMEQRIFTMYVVMKMIEQLSQTYRIPVLNAIRTDQIIGKAARAHKMIADLDPKAKALEDYEAATTSLLEMFDVEESARNPHGETVAV
jgi:nitrogenase subunit NifH